MNYLDFRPFSYYPYPLGMAPIDYWPFRLQTLSSYIEHETVERNLKQHRFEIVHGTILEGNNDSFIDLDFSLSHPQKFDSTFSKAPYKNEEGIFSYKDLKNSYQTERKQILSWKLSAEKTSTLFFKTFKQENSIVPKTTITIPKEAFDEFFQEILDGFGFSEEKKEQALKYYSPLIEKLKTKESVNGIKIGWVEEISEQSIPTIDIKIKNQNILIERFLFTIEGATELDESYEEKITPFCDSIKTLSYEETKGLTRLTTLSLAELR